MQPQWRYYRAMSGPCGPFTAPCGPFTAPGGRAQTLGSAPRYPRHHHAARVRVPPAAGGAALVTRRLRDRGSAPRYPRHHHAARVRVPPAAGGAALVTRRLRDRGSAPRYPRHHHAARVRVPPAAGGAALVTRRLRDRGSAPPVSAAGGCDGCALARSAVRCGSHHPPVGGSLRAVLWGTIAYRGALPRLDPHREPKRPGTHLLPRRRLVQDAISREQGASAPEVPGVRQPAEHGNALP